MPTTSSATTARMGEIHEEHLAEINGGRKSRSSGNQWHDQADGRNSRDDPFNFAWDGKSTLGKGITITLDMIAKIREQAGGERPQIGLRWYKTGDLTQVAEDWIAVRDVDFEEMKIAATAYEAAKEAMRESATAIDEIVAEAEKLREENGQVLRRLEIAQAAVAALRAEAAERSGDQGRVIPGFVPRLPWVTVHVWIDPDDPARKVVRSGVRYEASGAQVPFEVKQVYVERMAANRPRLIVNQAVVKNGTLYRQGEILARVWEDKPDQEIG
jgi:hypothetical protein